MASGYAAACKAVHAGSIPASASRGGFMDKENKSNNIDNQIEYDDDFKLSDLIVFKKFKKDYF